MKCGKCGRGVKGAGEGGLGGGDATTVSRRPPRVCPVARTGAGRGASSTQKISTLLSESLADAVANCSCPLPLPCCTPPLRPPAATAALCVPAPYSASLSVSASNTSPLPWLPSEAPEQALPQRPAPTPGTTTSESPSSLCVDPIPSATLQPTSRKRSWMLSESLAVSSPAPATALASAEIAKPTVPQNSHGLPTPGGGAPHAWQSMQHQR